MQKLLLALSPFLFVISAHSQGTAFTYQARLADNGVPANGIYDLRFTVYDALAGGNPVGSGVVVNDAGVTNGLFTVTLDPGANVFTGPGRWLDIAVRPGASAGSYTSLVPRQPLTPAPYAITAGNANAVAAGVVTAASIAPGSIGAAQLASNSITAGQLASGSAAANLAASGQGGVASGGLILSATENNAALVNAGYVKIGAMTTSDTWLERDSGVPLAPRFYHSAIWTGSEMIVWGGSSGSYLNDTWSFTPGKVMFLYQKL